MWSNTSPAVCLADTIQVLCHANYWFVDGTFKTCPDLFYQVYTIHALEQGRVLLCVYALLVNKTQPTYQCIFEEVKWLGDGSAPATLLMDFECAALNAAAAVFPDTVVKGCLFHLCQNVYKHIQSEGLQTLYREDDNIAIHARMIPFFAFIPPDQAEAALGLHSDELPDQVSPVVDYFECTYFGHHGRRGWRGVSFPIALWTMWNRVHQHLQHLGLAQKVPSQHCWTSPQHLELPRP